MPSPNNITEEKWYAPVDIGQHIDSNNVAEDKLSQGQIEEIFQKENVFRKESLERYEKLRDRWLEENGEEYKKGLDDNRYFRLDSGNHPVSADVYQFSKSRAKIWIKFLYGYSRWHHYYVVLGNLLMDRDDYIDEIFGLRELEKKYTFSFKGIAHGTPVDELERVLGNDYYEYASQSPQYRQLYYERHKIEVIVQDFEVKYLQKSRPGWMDTDMKMKKDTR